MSDSTPSSALMSATICSHEDFDWLDAHLGLCHELEQCARDTALRPPRGLALQALFRVVLAYVLHGWPSRSVASWAWATGLLGRSLSHVSLLAWLSKGAPCWRVLTLRLLTRLNQRWPLRPMPGTCWPLVSLDATCVRSRRRGSQGFERVHLLHEVSTGALRQVCLPLEQKVGETMRHFELGEGWVVVADRFYCSLVTFLHAKACGAHVIVRYRRLVGLYELDHPGQRLRWLEQMEELEEGAKRGWWAWLGKDERRCKVWVQVQKMSQEFAQDELEQLRQNRQPLNADARRHAPFMVVLSDLGPQELGKLDALEWYRLRWSGSEIAIRQAKSQQKMSQLPVKIGPQARAWLWMHLCGQVLAQWIAWLGAPQEMQSEREQHTAVKRVCISLLADAMMPLRLVGLEETLPLFLKHFAKTWRHQPCSSLQAFQNKLDSTLPACRSA